MSDQLHMMAWTPEAADLLAAAIHASPLGDFSDVNQELQGAYLFGYTHNGQEALIALHRRVSPVGTRVHLTGMVALPGSKPIQARQVMGQIEAMAYNLGADELTMMTRHKAIALSAPRWGGQITGAVIAKRLSKGH